MTVPVIEDGQQRVFEVPAELEQLRAIRGFVEEVAREAGLSEDRIFDVRVAASEACATALEPGPVTESLKIHARLREGVLLLDFHHPGSFRIRPTSPEHAGELGIPLMIALADDVTISHHEESGLQISLSFLLPQPPLPVPSGA